MDFELSSNQMLFDAEININLGTFYFRKLLNQFDNRIEYALAAYNAGPHRVSRWQNITPDDELDLFVENIEFSQTRNYVRKVMRNYWIYTFLDKIH
jgi:soluble lytic murein transglycosylase